MLTPKTRSFLKDVLLVGAVFAALSGAYLTFAVAERYRALTNAYLVQSQRIIEILNNQGATNAQESQPSEPN